MDRCEQVAGWELFFRKLRAVFIAWLMSAAFINGAPLAWALDVGSIEPLELKGQLDRWTIVDARPSRDWQRGHIPGALSFSWEEHIQSNGSAGSYRVPTPERLASVLGTMGITESTPVVVYGDADRSWGGEGWSVWVLSWLGHKGPIRLLDGGIQSWTQRGYSIASGSVRKQFPGRHYTMDIRSDLNVQAAQLDDRMAPPAIIDTRSSFEWMTGHLPNAIHIPWTEFFTGKERRPIDGPALSRLLREHGVDPEKPVVFYCTAGVRSAYAWMVQALAGSRTARNYWGGMSDWKEFSEKQASRTGV